MSKNLCDFVGRLPKKQENYLLKALNHFGLDVHAGSMWFVNRGVAIAALQAHLVVLKKEQSTIVGGGVRYFNPSKGKGAILDCLAILEMFEVDKDA